MMHINGINDAIQKINPNVQDAINQDEKQDKN